MGIGKKLLFSIGWLAAFVGLGALLDAANLRTPSEVTVSSLAGNTLVLFVVGVGGFIPLIMAILVWFSRPKWLYGKKKH